MRRAFVLLCLALASLGSAQFVWPKPEYNDTDPKLYVQDPFIIRYRERFFAVFRGDVSTFEKAYAEVQELSKKDPKDARARVWLGNGHTVKAGLMWLRGEREPALKLLEESRKVLDEAVALSPDDPNIYMMRAATLFVQGQYFPKDKLPKVVWERLRDDCLKAAKFIGPERMKTMASIHVRGEIYGSLGIAYKNLGETAKAIEAFEMVLKLNPGTSYETRAKREIAALQGKG